MSYGRRRLPEPSSQPAIYEKLGHSRILRVDCGRAPVRNGDAVTGQRCAPLVWAAG